MTDRGSRPLIDFGYGAEIAAPEVTRDIGNDLSVAASGSSLSPNLRSRLSTGRARLRRHLQASNMPSPPCSMRWSQARSTSIFRLSAMNAEADRIESPVPFAERGVEPWPELEEILARGLRKSRRTATRPWRRCSTPFYSYPRRHDRRTATNLLGR